MGDQVFGFGDIAKVMALGAMPWLNYLKPLRWHLRSSDFNPAPIFNAVATIAAAVLSFLYYSTKDPIELPVPRVIWLLPLFLVPALIYFVLFLSYKERVARGKLKWPLYVAFPIYVALFCSLAFIAGNLEVRRTYKIVWGTVLCEKKGIAGAKVDFSADSRPIASTLTELDGSFKVAVPRSAEVDELLVNKSGFEQYLAEIQGELKADHPPIELKRE